MAKISSTQYSNTLLFKVNLAAHDISEALNFLYSEVTTFNCSNHLNFLITFLI